MRLYHLLGVFLFLLAGIANAPAAEETAVVTEGKINVRGKPSLIGEVITQLENGEKVTVLERLTNTTAKAGEPTNWAKIKLPPNTPVWVFAPFIKEGVVSVSRLNIRAGRGENYSVIGRLNRGDAVKVIRSVEEWAEIEPPADTYAFVDSSLLQFDSTSGSPATQPQPAIASQTPAAATPDQRTETPATPTTAATEVPAQPANVVPSSDSAKAAAGAEPSTNRPAAVVALTPTPDASTTQTNTSVPNIPIPDNSPTVAAVTPAPTVTPNNETAAPETSTPSAPTPAKEPTTSAAVTPSSQSPVTATPPVTASPLPKSEDLPKVAPPVVKRSEPPPKRIVRREGIVRATSSIQAPTWYELQHATTGKRINYLFSDNMDLNLKDYRGQKVVVTGEEAIDPRWPNTPILDMQTLDVLPDDSK